MGSNFRVFHDTERFHEYLTHENLLSWVELEQYRSKNEILTLENRISIKTRKYPVIRNCNIYKFYLPDVLNFPPYNAQITMNTVLYSISKTALPGH